MMQNYPKNPKYARIKTKFNNKKKWHNRLDYTTFLWFSYCFLSWITSPPRSRRPGYPRPCCRQLAAETAADRR